MAVCARVAMVLVKLRLRRRPCIRTPPSCAGRPGSSDYISTGITTVRRTPEKFVLSARHNLHGVCITKVAGAGRRCVTARNDSAAAGRFSTERTQRGIANARGVGIPMNSSGSNPSPFQAAKAIPAHKIGRRLEQLRTDPGLRVLQHAKAHLWTDLLNQGTENENAIEFLSEFILYYTRAEESGRA